MIIPVYGQSLALGEEAIRITDFDAFVKKTNHHVVTQKLDEEFGYLSDTPFKQWLKSFVHDRHRAFELAIYGMSELVTDSLTKSGAIDTLVISTFPGGLGATSIVSLGKGSPSYNKFLDEIKTAYNKAKGKGWNVVVPAFCWMQGENDIVWNTSANYKRDLKQFETDLNKDIKAITDQKGDVICISYQTNCLTLSDKFNANSFKSVETSIPDGQMQLIKSNPLFMASGPTYPYSFVDERVHIDGVSQKRLGYLTGLAVMKVLAGKPVKGLIPEDMSVAGNVISIKFNVPSPPLVLDTINVLKAANYGFSVIAPDNTNILTKATLENSEIKLYCSRSPVGCKARYAVNGMKHKSGYRYGPRGNLRDSQGDKLTTTINNKVYALHNWCYQFDEIVQ